MIGDDSVMAQGTGHNRREEEESSSVVVVTICGLVTNLKLGMKFVFGTPRLFLTFDYFHYHH